MTDEQRVTALERENRRIFDDAQREADALFAQYQLSQLLASAGSLPDLAAAVVAEVTRLCDARSAVLWLRDPAASAFQLAASTHPDDPEPAERFADEAAAQTWCAEQGWSALVLADAEAMGVLAVRPRHAAKLDETGRRVLQLSRHELALAFRGAQLRDALERERKELTAIVQGATDAIVQVDRDRRVLRVNAAAERLLGQPSASLLGRSCSDVLGCSEIDAHGSGECPLAEVVATGEPIAYRESMVRGSDERVVRVAGGYSITPGELPETGRATAILRDISAVKALEDLRAGFVAMVSHELRTPLALMKGYTDSLLHLELDERTQQGFIERLDQITARLAKLVTDILDVTHLEADPLVLERVPVRIGAVVERLRADLAVVGHAQRLRIEVSPALPPVEADAARVMQVLENLVENALKYAPDTTAVRVGASVDGQWLTVTVEDDGVGIPEADRTLIFEPFHRARNVRESTVPGTGLGLHISRRLVEAHGGRLWIEDRPDGRPGTRASFSLPLFTRHDPTPAQTDGLDPREVANTRNG
jgi:PAS domain S-box-containing protein